MDRNQRGFTLIEILVVVTIIGVLAGLVVVLIPKGKFEAKKVQCITNVKNIVDLLELESDYPSYSGANLILYLVPKGELEGKNSLTTLFCPGDKNETLKLAGGVEAYDHLDMKTKGEYGQLTSYAGRDQKNKDCRATSGSTKQVVLVCDDSEDHHDNKGFVVGLTGGSATFRHKFTHWEIDIKTSVQIGEGSVIPELRCLRED